MLAPIPIALLLAVLAAALWQVKGRPGLPALALCWLAYAGYEGLMYARWLCRGECNIRVDLLLLYPPLLLAAATQLAQAARARWPRQRGG